MIKSVWLPGLIVSVINDTGSLLASCYRHLSGLIGEKNGLLCLSEPDEGGDTWFYLSAINACVVPSPDGETDEYLIRRVKGDRKTLIARGKLYCPLYFENSASFGALIFNAPWETVPEKELDGALAAFSTVLYSECMGSILHSVHDTVMKAEGVSVDYAHGKLIHRVVNRINLEINEKEFTVIVGASGSGKSTLLNVLGGMLSASEGKVMWKGTDVTKMDEKARTLYRAETVGFIFQRYNLISDLTAEENIEIAASLAEDPIPVPEVLDMVGLKHKAKSYPSELSGGEQQRICIARALVKRAELLLCDEPTGALDTDNAMQIIRILKGIAKEQGIPVVMITHNPNFVVLADHCITISNGRVSNDRLQPFALPAEALRLK